MNLRLLASSLALLLPYSAVQADTLYGELNYEIQYFEIADADFTPQLLTGTLGIWLSKGIALEGSYGVGITDDTADGLTLDTDRISAVNLRFESPNTNGATAYILLGGVSYELNGTQANSSFPGQETFDGYHIGMGLNQYFPNTTNTALNLSAHVYGVDEDIDSYGVRLGLRHDF